jgi:hypothetical protein
VLGTVPGILLGQLGAGWVDWDPGTENSAQQTPAVDVTAAALATWIRPGGPCIRAEKRNELVTNANKDNPCTTGCTALPYPDWKVPWPVWSLALRSSLSKTSYWIAKLFSQQDQEKARRSYGSNLGKGHDSLNAMPKPL